MVALLVLLDHSPYDINLSVVPSGHVADVPSTLYFVGVFLKVQVYLYLCFHSTINISLCI